MIRLLIVGPPGSGKGTQAAAIADQYGVPAIATGDIFRSNIREGTDLGLRVKEVVAAGDYVPDELTNALVDERLHEDDALDGFLLDGYPRTIDQVTFLDELLARRGQDLEAVILLIVDTDEVVRRLQQRSSEQGRADDSETAIRHRQEVFMHETAAVIDHYRERGIVIEIDALGSVDDVAARISAGLASRGISPS
ncbi:adenylate kinase [Salinibacterium sp. G-O1]|uniref:adenylate kinase n=1 Tax=Salinibacterium sp. G-O1 TaxID=3046208 RepID=UPI0024BB94B4|nr:adenylate kinase [Salinibacterium sp. G-O1]MDJ0336319.1 adenylate kinase [Salinibacterium sp. G-O1]